MTYRGRLRSFIEYHKYHTRSRPKLRRLLVRIAQGVSVFSQRRYHSWARKQSARRSVRYSSEPEAGLFSIISAVWDGSPVVYLKALAASIARQNPQEATEWVLVDNGCTQPEMLKALQALTRWKWVRIVRLDANAGIVRGLRAGLDAARGRYILAVDADDLLYPDALRTVAHHVRERGYPALLYTDEDKVKDGRFRDPYFKPDWDPVLLLNSAYIAHLGIIDREKAIQLGAYSDPSTEGSPDWDLFVRFWIAGHAAVHVPEVVYSWRMHSASTAEDGSNKSYIYHSQKAVLDRYVKSLPDSAGYVVADSPVARGVPQFRITKRFAESLTTIDIPMDDPAGKAVSIAGLVAQADRENAVLLFKQPNLRIAFDDWRAEVETLFSLHADAVMLGGRIVNHKNEITEAGRYFGFRGVCGDPHQGLAPTDPGYFKDLWCRHSVSAVSTRFAVVKAGFLAEVLKTIPQAATLGFLGAWAGAWAMRTGKRVVCSPFLGGALETPWDEKTSPEEERLFAELNGDLIPDTRFYSRHLSLDKPYAVAFER